MRNGRLLLVLVMLTSTAACRSFREPRPAARPPLAVVGREPLDLLPPDQYFTYVSAPTLFNGVVEFDTLRPDPRRIAGFRQSIQIPLTAIGWNESVPALAAYRIAVIEADRHHSAWSRFGACYRQVHATVLMRGFAIERVSDGAVFWRLYPGGQLDQDLIEKRASDDIANFVLGRATPFPLEEAPPAPQLLCPGEVPARVSAPQNPQPATAPKPSKTPAVAPDAPRPTPPPTADPVRRP